MTKGNMIEASLTWTDKDRFVGSASSRHSIEMDAGTEKTANSPMELVLASGYPAVYTAIHLTYLVRGQVSPKAMEDAVRLSKEKYCSVSAMLEKTAKITYTIEHVS